MNCILLNIYDLLCKLLYMKYSKLSLIMLILIGLPVMAEAGINIGSSATLRVTGTAALIVDGAWTNSGSFEAGMGTVTFVGTTSSNLNSGGSSFYNLALNKTSAADANDNLTVITNDLTVSNTTTITDGELVQGSTNLILKGMTLAAAGSYTNASTGDLTLSGDVSNAGSINLDASGTADSILIRSSIDGTQRDWTGAGTLTLVDVDVKDQSADSGTPSFVFVSSGTNSAGNSNWIFGGGALTNVNVEPVALTSGTEGDVAVTFTLANVLPNDGKVVIDFGSGFDATGLTNITNTSGIDGTWAIALSDGDGTNDIVTLTRQADGTQTAATTTIVLMLEDEVKNPTISGSTGSYTVSTQLNAGTVIDSGTATADLISAGALAGLSVTPEELFPGAIVNQTISLTTSNAIPLDGKILITYPDGFVLSTSTTATSASDLDGVLATSIDGQVLTITRSGGSAFGAGGVIDDLIVSNIRNPKNAGVTGTFTITTTDSADISIDEGSAASVTIAGDETLIRLSLSASPMEVRIGELVTFTATITNESNVTLTDFNYIHDLPAGMVLKTETAHVDEGDFNLIAQEEMAKFNEISDVVAGATRIITYQAAVGSNAKSGEFANTAYCQINPVISNTAQLMIRIIPDAVFDVGTLVGKVFWDKDNNGLQDEGELGLPNVQLATEEGFVITTDSHGRYHVKDFLTGRHMVKINQNSLPIGSKLTTPESKIVNQTDAMLTKVNFGVSLPDTYESILEGQLSEEANIIVTQDDTNPIKQLELEFFEIRYDALKKIYSQISPQTYVIDNSLGKNTLQLPFKIKSNYTHYIKSWKFEVLRESKDEQRPIIPNNPLKHRDWVDENLDTISSMTMPGPPPPGTFLPEWSAFQSHDGMSYEDYYIRIKLADKDGNEDSTLYYLWQEKTLDITTWKLTPVQSDFKISVKGTQVIMDGQTHAHKKVSLYDVETVSDEDGKFSYDMILPQGEYLLPVEIYKSQMEDPVIINRGVRLRDSYLFAVGFAEYELGSLSIKGNIEQASDQDKAQALDSFYDEGRLAYYLKGKIYGKYMLTASIDTDRANKKLFKNLEPEDFYSTYGDDSKVIQDADDTQDEYYLRLEADKSYLSYGNFNTGLTGTDLSDFNRSLNGSKLHYETNSIESDGKPTQMLTVFMAKSRQRAAHSEFETTGGSLYYLKHRGVIQGSDKIHTEVRDKVTGLVLQEKILVANVDYEIDYSEGRIRIYRPLSTFTFESQSFASTSILDGDLQYLVVDYEFEYDSFIEDVSTGIRASQSLFDNVLRVGMTHVQEERPLERYELTGVDGHIELPLNTLVEVEMSGSQLLATEQHVSTDGGINFTKVDLSTTSDQSRAFKIDIHSEPTQSTSTRTYYRKIDRDFSSSNTLSDAGTEKFGWQIIQDLKHYGELHLRMDTERLLDGGQFVSQQLTDTDSTTFLTQYFLKKCAWDAMIEYRTNKGDEGAEDLITGEVEFQVDPKTTLAFAAQMNLKAKESDKITAKLIRKISDSLSLVLSQSLGSKGTGTLLGLSTDLLGKRYDFQKSFGSRSVMSKDAQDQGGISNNAQETEIGINKNNRQNNCTGIR